MSNLGRLIVITIVIGSGGCTVSGPASWSVSVDQARTDPAPPVAEAPVAVVFRVTCQRTGGTGNKPVQIKVAASLVGELKVFNGVVDCSVGESPREAVTFVGYGRIELGKLRPGRHQVELTLTASGDGWTMPPPHAIDFVVPEAAR